ncbi:MAG: hypothetical protein ACOX7B_13115 [Christensenellales bacterium]|jgi:hypothetical protein
MSKTTYDNVQKNLSDLLKDIRNGGIGLPDLQRLTALVASMDMALNNYSGKKI